MSTPSLFVRHRLAVALIASLLVVTGWSVAVAQGTSVSPDSPVASSDGPGMAPGADPADGATLVVPDPTNFGGQPTPWDHVAVGSDGKTLMVYFWSGVDGCYGLKAVTVSVVDGVTAISLETGRRQDALGKMCVEMAQLYKTPIVLNAPILAGGAAG